MVQSLGCYPKSMTVDCGGSFAKTCSSCPKVNGTKACSGDCAKTADGKCVDKNSAVDCGGDLASSCAACPWFGAEQCSGDCVEAQSSIGCAPKSSSVDCGGSFATACAACPKVNGTKACSGDCMMTADGKCVAK